MHMLSLPEELLDVVLQFLGERNIATCRLVCRGWEQVAMEKLFRYPSLRSLGQLNKLMDTVAPNNPTISNKKPQNLVLRLQSAVKQVNQWREWGRRGGG